MSDKHKTKAQLVNELAQMRQRVSELEDLTVKYQHQETELKMQAEGNQRQLIESLHQASNILSSSLNYATVLDYTLEQLGQFIPHNAACIMLAEGDAAQIFRWHGYVWSETKNAISSLIFNINDIPPLRQVRQTWQALVLPVVKEGDLWLHQLGDDWIKSHLTAPIVVRNQVVGFINVDSNKPGFYSQLDADRLQLFINQAAISLTNAQVYDQARRESAQRLAVLRKERNFASAVLNTVGALVMVVTPQGRVLRFNRACEQTTGYSLDDIRGEYFWDIFLSAADKNRIQQGFETLHQTGLPYEYECTWLTKDRRTRIIAWVNTILLDNEGRTEYVISTGTDITERRQLEDRLAAIHQLGRELNLLRDETAICKNALDTVSFLLQIKSSGYGVLDRASAKLTYQYYPRRGIPEVIELNLPLAHDERLNLLKTIRGYDNGTMEDTQPSLSVLASNPYPSWLSASMKVRERTIGVIDVECQPPHHFSENDRRLLQTLADQTAVALENARLYRETQQRVDELTTLTMISQAITSTLKIENTLTIITDHTIRLLNATAASVVLVDQTRGDMWFNAASGGQSDFVKGKRLPAGEGIVGWVIQRSEAALVPDVSQDPRFFGKIDLQTGFKTRSVICVPLQSGTSTTGAIEVINKIDGTFTNEDLRLLTWLATPASIALENARLFEAERSARKQAEILREATSTLTSTLELDKVLNDILVHLEHMVPYDHAFVFLHREDEWLQIVGERGQTAMAQSVGHRHSTDNAIYQEIRKTAHPVILADAQTDAHFKTWNSTDKVRGWMGVPLIVQNKVIGCLTLNSGQVNAYDQIEAYLAQAFANQAAVAIQNAQLFQQVRTGHNQLQSLSRRLVEVQETERRNIARELHDEAGQALTSLMVGLRLLESEKECPEAIVERATELRRVTNDVSENLHRLAINLRPASLDYLGLVAALRQYLKGFGRQHEIAIHFEPVGFDDQRLPTSIETNLYRIVQEALTNVARHAQATRLDILLERRDGQVITIIEDNGVGFDPDEAKQRGRLGILGIRERTEMLNGTLTVESTIGTGTTIYVEVPYDNSDSNSG
ncbi:MAG TPA: GAF domain-containing protein [Anaerolineae bacterium]|nr:GAF domain-containing protein [Anaerolineae bacterium]MCB0223753.1 GAF domain-containing protein [Anaerolineae bacterium]MCB9105913.1 GAF domain-containing protein [Anaerolineales bacterium]HRV93342.1 GAF domain-containing protein [Anaerolineae bacterium]